MKRVSQILTHQEWENAAQRLGKNRLVAFDNQVPELLSVIKELIKSNNDDTEVLKTLKERLLEKE